MKVISLVSMQVLVASLRKGVGRREERTRFNP